MIIISIILSSPKPPHINNKISAEKHKHFVREILRLGESFTCCCVDGNFRDAACLITHLYIVLSLEVALYTGPGVTTSGKTKGQLYPGTVKSNEVSITDTESTEESQSCPLIRDFPRPHSLSINPSPL